MAHSHLLVQHLLKQLERHAAERDLRDHRPAWLVTFVQRAADCFAPLSGVGRVGFECEPGEGGWEARLYLGETEIVGGKDDGQWRSVSFEVDLASLTQTFTRVDVFRWNVSASSLPGASFITISGLVDTHPICLKAYSRAPQHAGPGLRQYLDGSIQPVQ